MVAFLDGLFFSEILADNAGGSAFDTDGDGSSNKADEFVEIQNNTKDPIDLSNYSLWSLQRGELFDFGDVTGSTPTIAVDDTATVIGNYTGTPPSGSNYFSAGLPDNNTNQGLLEDGENGKWDTLYLVNESTGEFIAFEYGPNNPSDGALPVGFPGTTLVGSETTSSDATNGLSIQRDANGDLVEGPPDPDDPGPVCFVAGTLILTPSGPRAIDNLSPGDLIVTRDHGPQPVRWIGESAQSSAALRARPALRPVRLRRGALGDGMPERDLDVSPQHRVVVQSRIGARMFGPEGVLVPAGKLLPLPGVEQLGTDPITYYHLLLDRHEVIFAEGCATESLFLGPMAQESLGAEAMEEIALLFPDLAARLAQCPARAIPKGHRVRSLVARHARNPERALVDGS